MNNHNFLDSSFPTELLINNVAFFWETMARGLKDQWPPSSWVLTRQDQWYLWLALPRPLREIVQERYHRSKFSKFLRYQPKNVLLFPPYGTFRCKMCRTFIVNFSGKNICFFIENQVKVGKINRINGRIVDDRIPKSRILGIETICQECFPSWKTKLCFKSNSTEYGHKCSNHKCGFLGIKCSNSYEGCNVLCKDIHSVLEHTMRRDLFQKTFRFSYSEKTLMDAHFITLKKDTKRFLEILKSRPYDLAPFRVFIYYCFYKLEKNIQSNYLFRNMAILDSNFGSDWLMDKVYKFSTVVKNYDRSFPPLI